MVIRQTLPVCGGVGLLEDNCIGYPNAWILSRFLAVNQSTWTMLTTWSRVVANVLEVAQLVKKIFSLL